MSIARISTVLLAIVGVAILTVAVTHTQTSNIITAFGNAFSGSLKVAMGG